jgi:protein-disulfide isomerase
MKILIEGCFLVVGGLVLGGLAPESQGAAGAAEVEPAQVETEGHPAMGPAAAPVTIVEFGDFECPRCGAMHPVLREVLANYPDQVRLVFRQLPLGSVHPYARKAAEASLCAFDQGRFWEFHDALFADQGDLSRPSLGSRASALDLDVDRFSSCLDSGEKEAAVERDIEAAIEAGAYSVPTLYINGQMLTGSWPYREVADRVDAELYRLLQAEIAPSEEAGP